MDLKMNSRILQLQYKPKKILFPFRGDMKNISTLEHI